MNRTCSSCAAHDNARPITGAPLPGLSSLNPTLLTAYTYWISLAVVVAVLATVYLMLRSRLGLELTAVRDGEVGARSAAARGVGVISQLNVQPTSAFSVQWSAEMIFVTIIGGIGTIEGPILGTIIFFVLQQTLSSYGAWYLIVLGLVAMAVAIFARRGLWGLVADRFHIRIFPVGYWLWPDGQGRPGRRMPARRSR